MAIVISTHSDSDELNELGVSLTSVRALIPELDIDAQSSPTEAQAQQHLADISNAVLFRLGDFTEVGLSDGVEARFLGEAQRIVRLGTAAQIISSAYPDVGTINGTDYGSILWKRYEDALENLAMKIDIATPGDPSAGNGTTSSTPAISAPPPAFTSFMPF